MGTSAGSSGAGGAAGGTSGAGGFGGVTAGAPVSAGGPATVTGSAGGNAGGGASARARIQERSAGGFDPTQAGPSPATQEQLEAQRRAPASAFRVESEGRRRDLAAAAEERERVAQLREQQAKDANAQQQARGGKAKR